MIERSFRIEEEVYLQLKDISEREQLPISYLLRLAIKRFLDSYYGNIMEITPNN